MKMYVFYVNDPKCKNTDILDIDANTMERIKKDLREGKPVLEIRPGESSITDKHGTTVITYYQFISMSCVCKVILDDVN